MPWLTCTNSSEQHGARAELREGLSSPRHLLVYTDSPSHSPELAALALRVLDDGKKEPYPFLPPSSPSDTERPSVL